MSTTSASQKRSKSRPVDLPGFTGKADRLGLDKTVVKKRKQPATGVKHEEPRRKKPRPEQKRDKRVSQESGDAGLPVDQLSSEVASFNAEPAAGRTELAVNREELAGIEIAGEPGQDEVKVEMAESDHSCRRTLTDLPVELLLQIHELAGSSDLPCVSRYIHAALSDHTPLQAVQWLVNRYGGQGPLRFLSLALRHPVCDVSLMQNINHHWEEMVHWQRADLKMKPILSPIGKALLPMYSNPLPIRNHPYHGLPCDNVPRRVFRIPAREEDQKDMTGSEALAFYILREYVVSDKVLSYGVRHAVYTNQADWARRLMGYGGNPFDKGGLALEIAMRRGDLDMVRVLVETSSVWARTQRAPTTAVITDEIKALILKFATREILDYFVKERKVKLSLGSILAL